MIKQRVMGALLVLISTLVMVKAANGMTFVDRDATVVCLILPLGLYMIFTKNYVLYS